MLQAFPEVIKQVAKGGFGLAAEGMHVCHHWDAGQPLMETRVMLQLSSPETQKGSTSNCHFIFIHMGSRSLTVDNRGFSKLKYFWYLCVICVSKISFSTH